MSDETVNMPVAVPCVCGVDVPAGTWVAHLNEPGRHAVADFKPAPSLPSVNELRARQRIALGNLRLRNLGMSADVVATSNQVNAIIKILVARGVMSEAEFEYVFLLASVENLEAILAAGLPVILPPPASRTASS